MKAFGLVLVALAAVVGLLSALAATVQDGVPLREHDPDAYQEMIDWYVDAGWEYAEAVRAADRITVDGVVVDDEATPTPAPTPTPTPTPDPSGALQDVDPEAYLALVEFYMDAGFSEQEARAAANKVKVGG